MNATNNHRSKIDELIAQTDDPVLRTVLMVVASIDNAAERNAIATEAIAKAFHEHREEVRVTLAKQDESFADHRVEFNRHVIDEQAILSGVRWAWWAATGMGAAILALGLVILRMYASTIEISAQQISVNTNRLTIIEAQILELTRRQQLDEERHRTFDARRLGGPTQ